MSDGGFERFVPENWRSRPYAEPVAWAYATRPDWVRKWAVGFVMARSESAAKRIAHAHTRYAAHVYVWPDPDKVCAPASKYPVWTD